LLAAIIEGNNEQIEIDRKEIIHLHDR
jgi:hypothetical protein